MFRPALPSVAASCRRNSGIPTGSKPDCGEDADADAVGLVFVLAREVDLLCAARPCAAVIAPIVASLGTPASRRSGLPRASPPSTRGLRATGILDAACDVTLRHMRDFVGEDARELASLRGRHQQTRH